MYIEFRYIASRNLNDFMIMISNHFVNLISSKSKCYKTQVVSQESPDLRHTINVSNCLHKKCIQCMIVYNSFIVLNIFFFLPLYEENLNTGFSNNE